MNSHCGSADHFHRRNALKLLGLSGLGWLTPASIALGRLGESKQGKLAKSLILLWLDGGNSQLETFDPHPGSDIAGGTKAIDTNVKGIQLAAGMPKVAEQMELFSIVRNVVTKEGDHERANYNVKTGFRPDPTLVHPSVGALLAHQLPAGITEIPRHVSIFSGGWPSRGGYLGDQYDAFKTGDPNAPIPDVSKRVSDERYAHRLEDVQVLDRQFRRGRLLNLEANKTLHQSTIQQSVQMMSSDQLKAFDVSNVAKSDRLSFGDSPFGRGCLAAARLVEVGVRCVEVTLSGWDVAHVANHTTHEGLVTTLDDAMSGLLSYLQQRDQLKDTVVMCCGEFGRTPAINPAAGRDHWPHGFSVAIAGGNIAGGRVIGETDPGGKKIAYKEGTPIEDVHATVLNAMGINYAHELDTPVNRPMKLSEGTPIQTLYRS